MISLEIPFFRHYVFAVVQTSSSPTHPGGNPPSIRYARVRERSGNGRARSGYGGRDTDALHRILNITTGTVALLLNRMPFHPSKQQPYKFSALSVLSVDKNGLPARSRHNCVKPVLPWRNMA